MKKMLSVIMIFAFVLSGCSFFGKNDDPKLPPDTAKEEPQQKQDGKKDYVIGLNSPVEGAKEWADRYKPYQGVFMQKKGDYRLLLISQGEMFSEGYKVSVNKVEKQDDKWVVTADIIKPAEEDYAGSSVYPFELMSILDNGKPVEVVKSDESNSEMKLDVIEIPEGKQFAVSKNFIVFSPLEGDKITSPVKIQGKARVFEANFRIVIEDGHNVLAEKVMMSDAGAPAWGNFDVNLPFEKATNPSGSVIFSYENMENGKMIEELMVPVKFNQ